MLLGYRIACENKIGFVVLLLALWVAPFQIANSQEQIVRLEEQVAVWAMHEDEGRLFCAYEGANEVIELDYFGTELNRFAVGHWPAEMIIKNNCLIVCSVGEPLVTSIDLKENKVIGQIKFDDDTPFGVFCTKAENNFAYVVVAKGREEGVVHQFDFRLLKKIDAVRVPAWGQSKRLRVTTSEDGKLLMPNVPGDSNSNLGLMSFDEEELQIKMLVKTDRSMGEVSADSANRFWGVGKTIYSRNMLSSLHELSGVKINFHPNYNLVASVGYKGLYFSSMTTGEEFRSLAITELSQNHKRSIRTRGKSTAFPFAHMGWDLKRNLAFIGLEKSAHLVSLNMIRKDLKPINLIVAPTRTVANVGETTVLPLRSFGANSDGKFELQDAPKWVSVIGKNLEMSPAATDLGTYSFVLKLMNKDGELSDRLRIALESQFPRIQLGFEPVSLVASQSGNFALAWGYDKAQSRRGLSNKDTRFALIDLKKRTLLNEKTVPFEVKSAVLDDQYIFFTLDRGKTIYRFDHSLSDERKTLPPWPPELLCLLDENRLFVARNGEQRIIDVDSMKETGNGSELMSSEFLALSIRGVRGQRGIGKRSDTSSSPVLGIPIIATGRLTRPQVRREGRSSKWARNVTYGGLTDGGGKRIPVGSRQSVVLEQLPVVISLMKTESSRIMTQVFDIRNVSDGAAITQFDVNRTGKERRSPAYSESSKQIIAVDGNVYFINKNEILIVKIPAESLGDVPIPLRFADDQGMPILKVGGNSKWQLRTEGTEKVTFALKTKTDHVSVNSDTGEITLDCDNIWKEFASSVSISKRDPGNANLHISGVRPINVEKVNSAIKKHMGMEMKPSETAAQMFLTFTATNEKGFGDEISFTVLVAGPVQAVEDNARR